MNNNVVAQVGEEGQTLKQQEPICDKDKAKQFVENYTPSSPMINSLDTFFQSGDCNKAIIAMAIAGNESLYGTKTPYVNAWGYGCDYEGRRFDCGWTTWEQAIVRYMEIADNYLSIYDGSEESIKSIAYAGYYRPGADGASIGQVDEWVDDVYWFTLQIK